jgi:Zn-dependent protease/tetratricopeptide (TPR) repeat protein
MPGPEVTFYSVFSDGTLLITLNGREHNMAGLVPNAVVADPYAPDLPGQWQAHQQRFAELAHTRKAVPVSATVHRTRTRMALNGYVDRLLEDGVLRTTDDGAMSPAPWHAWRIALRMLRGELRMGRLRGSSASPAAVPVEAEARAYHRLRDIERLKPFGWVGKTLLFLISVAAFSLVFGVALSVQTVLVIIGVLLFHELGHLAAMAAFRYRDLQILFIPFLGAAALGKDDDARPWQRIAVYLMGPLPGLLLGGYLLELSTDRPEPWLRETAVVMLVLNYLNLLPVMPLDGGHIMRLVLFDRFPRGRAILVGASALLFLAAAWYVNDPLFWILGAALALLAPTEWRSGRLLAHIRDALPAAERGGRAGVEAVFRAMRGPGFAGMGFPLRYRIATTAREYFGQTHASAVVAASALALYALVLIAPLGLVAVPYLSLVAAGGEGATRAAQRNWNASLAAATGPKQRWEVAQQAGDWYAERDDAERSYGFYRQAVDIAKAFGDADARLGRSHLGAARVAGDPEISREHYRQALTIQEASTGADSPEVADLLADQAWNYGPGSGRAAEGEAMLERALAIREASPDDIESLSGILQSLGTFRDMHGDRDGARSALERALTLRDQHGAAGDSLTMQLVEQIGTLCAVESKHTCAELQFSRMIDGAGDVEGPEIYRSSTASRGYTKLGWVMFVRGDVRSAQRHFERALEENAAVYAAIPAVADERNPAAVPLLLDLAYLHWTQGRSGLARDYVAQADGIVSSLAGTGIADYLSDVRQALSPDAHGANQEWLRRRAGAHADLVNAMGSNTAR